MLRGRGLKAEILKNKNKKNKNKIKLEKTEKIIQY
jgi:hypothetical protein